MHHTPPTVLAALLFTVPLFAACGDDDGGGTGLDNRRPNAAITPSATSTPANDDFMTIITLDGSGSSDPDGDALTFSWTLNGGRFENGSTASDASVDVAFPGTNPYDVRLTVRDPDGATDTATVTITVQGTPNQAPVASAVPSPSSVPAGDNNTTVVTLDGSGSFDPDGDPLTFAWTVDSGTFVNGTSATDEIPQVTFPGNAPYGVRLIVSDGVLADTANTLVDLN